MTKIIKYTLLLFALMPISALAATTISFSPLAGEYREGQTFSVNVVVNPQSPVYTVKAELNYSANLLEVQSFTFANNWMPLSQSGYDLIDNSNGVLIKTAGYPSGLSSQAALGTVVFRVKARGSATVKLGDGSLVLDGNNANTINNFSSQVIFTLMEKVVSTTPTPTPQPKTITQSVVSQIEPEPQTATPPEMEENIQPGELAEVEQEAQTAAVSGASSILPGIWLTAIFVLLSLVIGFLAGRKTEILSNYLSKKW